MVLEQIKEEKRPIRNELSEILKKQLVLLSDASEEIAKHRDYEDLDTSSLSQLSDSMVHVASLLRVICLDPQNIK